jgi:hypothetical protein
MGGTPNFPYFGTKLYYNAKGKPVPITPEEVKEVLLTSKWKDTIYLYQGAMPHLVRNSCKSDTCRVFFDIYNSQGGEHLCSFKGRCFMLGDKSLTILPAKKQFGVPICPRCWRYSHCTSAPLQDPAVRYMCQTPSAQAPHIYCQNVGHKHTWTINLLEQMKSVSDILFLQELPWATVRYTAFLTEKDGVPFKGPPIHPDWIALYPKGFDPAKGQPHVLAYINCAICVIKPKLHSDIVNHCNVMIVTV